MKTLEDFDLDYQPATRRDVLAHLASTAFFAEAENVILLGPLGVGRMHLAIGLGVKAAQAGYPVMYDTATNWVARLATAHGTGRLDEEPKRLKRYRLLIIHEVRYIPFDANAANQFFQLVASRYEQDSILDTANRPSGAEARPSQTTLSPPR